MSSSSPLTFFVLLTVHCSSKAPEYLHIVCLQTCFFRGIQIFRIHLIKKKKSLIFLALRKKEDCNCADFYFELLPEVHILRSSQYKKLIPTNGFVCVTGAASTANNVELQNFQIWYIFTCHRGRRQ